MIVTVTDDSIEGNWFNVPFTPPRDDCVMEVKVVWVLFLDDLYATADRFQLRTEMVPLNGSTTLVSTYCGTPDLDIDGNYMGITPSTILAFRNPKALRVGLWNTVTNDMADPNEVLSFAVELLFSPP
jgi:hypothetical protein